jgi:hypothetical protein
VEVPVSSLFTEQASKKNLKQKREQLRSDRFKRELIARTSKTEQVLVKRIASKQKSQPEKKKTAEEDLEDLWASPYEVKSRSLSQFKEFSKKDQVKVKPVILPKGGLSYNPSHKDHAQNLAEAAQREQAEIEKQEKQLKVLYPSAFAEKDSDQESEQEPVPESSDSDEPAEELTNKPVDRTQAKTQAQRNKDKLAKVKQMLVKKEAEQRKMNKDLERVDKLVQQVENLKRKSERKQTREKKAQEAERRLQEEVGIVNKPKVLGRFKYSQKKPDFQLEEDLAENLRKMKPLGNDMLLLDRFDSVFRRNLIEPDAPTMGEKKRMRKQKYKFVNKIGSTEQELKRAVDELKEKNDLTSKKGSRKAQKRLAAQDVIQL